jgi:hypothetical protein
MSVLPSFALKNLDTADCGRRQGFNELAALGLDCGPRRPKSLVIRAKGNYEQAFIIATRPTLQQMCEKSWTLPSLTLQPTLLLRS